MYQVTFNIKYIYFLINCMPAKTTKQQGTQDFFPRSATSEKTKGFIFNQAPLNKREAQKETVENLDTTKKKRSAFMAKLYEEDEALDDEMKVFDIDRINDVDEEGKEESKPKKRQEKANDKKGVTKGKSTVVQAQKINRLKFSIGSLGLFAISEIHPTYLIVNYTRNTKGFIPLPEESNKKFELGQLVVAAVTSQGTTQYNLGTSGNQNKKVQLTLANESINKSLTVDTVSANMVLQGTILSKEAKGFLIDFGLKDKTKGFLPFSDATAHLTLGQVVTVIAKTAISSSKVIKCEPLTPENAHKSFVVNKDITIHNLKPGFLVSGKVSKILENGLEVSFLGGFNGTIFADHLDKEEVSKYKVGEKVNVRVIQVDPQTQNIGLSLLPHLIRLENVHLQFQNEGVVVGKNFENATVSKVAFGDSYKIQLTKNVFGFLHKIHTVKLEKLSKEDAEPSYTLITLEKGQKLAKIRVKEINYFDGVPILSLRDDILQSAALTYNLVKCGEYVTAKIEEVKEDEKYVLLALNEFVKGRLYLEHMGDLPLKTIPPKYKQVGKEIKVRVFGYEAEKRYIEFTKKESLLKDKTPVYQSYKEVNKGDKIVGVIVGENDHGFIVKSFGNIKALLTSADIKAHGGKKKGASDLKFGSIVKAYVLFKKKDKGLALTMDKAKAKELRQEAKESGKKRQEGGDVTQILNFEKDFLPTEQQVQQIKEKYKTFMKASSDSANVGKVLTFRVIDTIDGQKICKSLDAPKKAQNIIAVLPSVLINKHHLASFTIEDFTFQGIVMEVHDDQVPIISSQLDLISLKDQIPSNNDQIGQEGVCFVGIVNDAQKNGVTVRFLNKLKKLVLIKDLETSSDFQEIYKVGKVVRVAKNKLGRLCLKEKVIYAANKDQQAKDKELQIRTLFEERQKQLQAYEFKAGEKVQAEISLVKDYGIISFVQKYQGLTGFTLTEQLTGKSYEEGKKYSCVVLDMDYEKEMLDLSEKLLNDKKTVQIKDGSVQRVVVELNKEDYLIVSFKNNKQAIGLLIMNNFNNDQSPSPNEKYQMGDELDVQVVSTTEQGFILTVPVIVSEKKEKSGKVELQSGSLVNAQIRSIKGQTVFLAIAYQSQLTIGRLHKMECQSSAEFEGFTVGESIQAKVLKISQDQKKTWIELTRRKEHLSKGPNTLDEQALKKTFFSLDDLKNNETYDAMISEVNYSYSQPITIALSSFVKGQIAFDKIVSADTLLKEGSAYLQRYKPGSLIKVKYNAKKGDFAIVDSSNKTKLSKGDIVIARCVKTIQGKGIAVQITEKVFGFIEICELTDDITGRVIDTFVQNNPIFVARVINFDKQEKPILSARDSIVDASKWKNISPEGKSIHFQKFDDKAQKLGNQRNKILKFGANVAINQGDLALGYITNIGKSGCFIQIGHQCTVRAGLNELSDSSSFDFKEQMPLGRLVLGRIYKVDENNGTKRFNITLRKSAVVFGTNSVDRDSLEEGSQVECSVVAVLEGGVKAIAQIRGSYLKVKVKDLKKGQVKEGDNLVVKLTKVTKQKITASVVGKTSVQSLGDDEQRIEKVWQSVEEEAVKDIEFVKMAAKQAEIDQEHLKTLGQNEDEDEIDQQYKDLKELEAGAEDEEMESVQNDDSDVEEMQRIIKETKTYEDEDEEDDDEDDEDEDVDMEEPEEEESEDEEAEPFDDEDSEEEDITKKVSGKKQLKARIREEMELRKKENNMRDNTDVPTSIDDYERLLVANQDQSYVWIQYMAFMIDKLGIESARRVAERAVKSVSISNEEDKFNLWIAYMNLENNFGSQGSLLEVVKRALEVNDRKKIYLQLISIYTASQKYDYIEEIFKQLAKKYNTSFKIWTQYLEFLFKMRELKKDPNHAFLIEKCEFSEPKTVLQRALQALPKTKHVNIISKFGQLEFRNGHPENGRTMFEGIVNNYPKRMDVWAVYMDMEVKYGGDNKQQARHLFERCLANADIQKKPKKMKLVFQKYMEYETANGQKKNVEKLRQRVEEYLEKAFKSGNKDAEESD